MGTQNSRTDIPPRAGGGGAYPYYSKVIKSTMYYHKAPLAISRGGRSEALGRSLCVIRVGGDPSVVTGFSHRPKLRRHTNTTNTLTSPPL